MFARLGLVLRAAGCGWVYVVERRKTMSESSSLHVDWKYMTILRACVHVVGVLLFSVPYRKGVSWVELGSQAFWQSIILEMRLILVNSNICFVGALFKTAVLTPV
jgi:hypothetical protein